MDQGDVWSAPQPHPALSTVNKRHFTILTPMRSVACLSLHTCFKKKASSSSKTSSSKKSSSSISEIGTAARAALSLLLREKPLHDAWRYPPTPQKKRKKLGYSGNPSVNHGANINTLHYPIREIKHVHLSFNCSVFCSLNSAWLRAVRRKMELQSASKSSDSQRDGGAHLK